MKKRVNKDHKEKDWGPDYCKECDSFTVQGGLKEHQESHKDIKPKEWQII